MNPWEWISCLWERDWWAHMTHAWLLYVDLGDKRRSLSRMVRREVAQIPRG